MPRDGSGVYHTPAGTDGVPGFTVESAKYNVNVHDVENDLNAVRPIIAGGTGSTSAGEALVRLGGEQAYQVVVDYDNMLFSPGSFKSSTTALNSPVDGHAFAGICTTNDPPPSPATAAPPNVNLTLEARDQTSTDTPGLLYVRQKKAGVWGAWSVDGDAHFVKKAGDTMTGSLTIDTASPHLLLNNPASGSECGVISSIAGDRRWLMQMGDGAAESGVSTGSNFALRSYNNAGVMQDAAFSIERATGVARVNAVRTARFALDRSDNSAGASCDIYGTVNGVPRWLVSLGGGVGETGGNNGSNFSVNYFSDVGDYVGTPIEANRVSGDLFLCGGGQHTTIGGPVSVAGGIIATGGFTTTAGSVYWGGAVSGVPGGGNTDIGGGLVNVADGAYLAVSRNTPGCGSINLNTDGAQLTFYRSGAAVGFISVNSTGTTYSVTSDAGLKDDMRVLSGAGAIIDNTKIYDFRWKSTGERGVGVLAQEAYHVYPAAVAYNSQANVWGVDYSKYTPLLLAEVQSLRRYAQLLVAEVQSLRQCVKELTQRIELLEASHGSPNAR